VEFLRKVEFRLVSELMKNCRRSDRELAKVLGISQPTVSRAIRRMEEEGVIKEYTMIPDFNRLGYKILALTFVRLKRAFTQEKIEKAQEITKKSIETGPFEVVMLERGLGLAYDGVFISYHEDYSSHVKFMKWLRQFDFLELEESGSFMINLDDTVRYRPLTFSTLAKHVKQLKRNKQQ
jgi:DNA-binding Lrp family transcriptional regulator